MPFIYREWFDMKRTFCHCPSINSIKKEWKVLETEFLESGIIFLSILDAYYFLCIRLYIDVDLFHGSNLDLSKERHINNNVSIPFRYASIIWFCDNIPIPYQAQYQGPGTGTPNWHATIIVMCYKSGFILYFPHCQQFLWKDQNQPWISLSPKTLPCRCLH